MGHWTDQGFVATNLQTYKDQLAQIFVDAYGSDFITDDSTPQGILIQRIAELLFNTDMDGIEAWSRLNLNTMSGVFLDLVGAMRGIARSQGSPQLAFVNVTCTASNFQPFTINAGTRFTVVGSEDTFVLPNSKTLTTPTGTLILSNSQNGNSSAIVGSYMQVSGYGQITSMQVTNLVDGQPVETDMDYRRRLQTEYPAASNTIEWVQNKLLESPLVRVVGCNYNDQATEEGGLAPYSTEWMAVPVAGANLTAFSEEVGTIIVNNKVPGSPTDGNTTVTVNDIFNAQKQVKFTIPAEVQLEIDVRVTTPETTGFLDLSNLPTIRAKIAEYINNLEIGKDVSYSRCAGFLFADPGFDVQYFKIRALPDAEAWVPGQEYQTGAIVEYQGTYYISTVNNNTAQPGVSGWDVYNTGWVENANFTIGPREYASIVESNINIEV